MIFMSVKITKQMVYKYINIIDIVVSQNRRMSRKRGLYLAAHMKWTKVNWRSESVNVGMELTRAVNVLGTFSRHCLYMVYY